MDLNIFQVPKKITLREVAVVAMFLALTLATVLGVIDLVAGHDCADHMGEVER